MRPHGRCEGQWSHGAGCGRRGCAGGLRFVIVIGIFVAIAMSMRNREVVTYAAPSPASFGQHGAQSYMSGLTVEDGQTLRGDAVVYTGDATVKGNGRIIGNLLVYSGDATVESGGEVTGDVTLWSGDVSVNGRVGGNVTTLSGDVELGGGAVVGGDVSSLRGDIDRDERATVGGNVTDRPQIGFSDHGFDGLMPLPLIRPEAAAAPGAVMQSTASASFFGGILSMVAQVFGAFFATILFTLVTMVIYTMRPNTVERIQKGMRMNLARMFALGITVNVVLWLLMTLLRMTWCLSFVAIAPALALFVLVGLGWTAIGRSIGQRLFPSLRVHEPRPVLEVALGVFLMSGAVALAGALVGGVFATPMVLLALIVSAPGVGAFVEPWVESYRGRGNVDLSKPGTAAAPAADSSPVAASAPAPVAPAPMAERVEVVPIFQAPPAQSAPAQDLPDVDLGAVESEAIGLSVEEGAAGLGLSAVTEETPVSFDASAEDLLLQADESAATEPGASHDFVIVEETPVQGDGGLNVGDLVAASDADVAAAAAAEADRKAAAQIAAGEPPAGVDFTRIQGIGRSADRKLRAAGILTYAQLAAAPVEMVAAVLGVSVEEVIEDGLQKQANALAS